MRGRKLLGWLRYRFDRSIAAGTLAMIGWLAAACLLVVAAATAVIVIGRVHDASQRPPQLDEAFWQSLLRVLDPGTMAGDAGWAYRLLTLLVTLAGVFVFGALIAVLTAWIGERLDELRRGRTPVLERDHTVVLGWSSSALSVIDQLDKADPSRHDRTVVLAPRDKLEMEEEINRHVRRAAQRGSVICRTGSPLDAADIALVGPERARSVIVLSPDAEQPDAQVLKTLLALEREATHGRAPPVVAEIRERRNLEAARLASGGRARLIHADDLIARIIVQSCRQSGMSQVYLDLLDFDGCELQPKSARAVEGRTFGEVLGCFERLTPVGIVEADGRLLIAPPMERVIGEGERLMTLTQDKLEAAVPDATPEPIQEALIVESRHHDPAAEDALILGWNRRGGLIVRELARFLPEGSRISVVADGQHVEPEIADLCRELPALDGRCRSADTSDPGVLRGLGLKTYRHVIVLGYTEALSAEQADTRTIVTLLHLRAIGQETEAAFNVVSEMLDERTRQLAENTGADDFVVSERLVSFMLAQVSQDAAVQAALEALLRPEQARISILPAGDYVAPGAEAGFATVVEAARRRGEIALGCRVGHARGRRVELNPPKSKTIALGRGDGVVVLTAV